MQPHSFYNEIQIKSFIKEASLKLNCLEKDVDFCKWVEVFPTTAGPRWGKNVIAGRAFTAFEIFGFNDKNNNDNKIKYCPKASVWLKWNGKLNDNNWTN